MAAGRAWRGRPATGRTGLARLVSDAATGRCAVCGRAVPRRLDRSVIEHKAGAERFEGSGQLPAAYPALTSWLPVLTGLTPHGLRHGRQTWLQGCGGRYATSRRQPCTLTRDHDAVGPGAALDRHATSILAARTASAARSSTLAGSPALAATATRRTTLSQDDTPQGRYGSRPRPARKAA
jgi:hypothetical protein